MNNVRAPSNVQLLITAGTPLKPIVMIRFASVYHYTHKIMVLALAGIPTIGRTLPLKTLGSMANIVKQALLSQRQQLVQDALQQIT